MKILLINDHEDVFGGVENYIYELMDRDTKLNFRLFGKIKEPSALKKFYNLETRKEIKKEIVFFEPDIIHAFNIGRTVTPSFMGYARKKKIPIILSFRDYHYICPKTFMMNDDGTLIKKHDSAIECILHHVPKKNILYDALKYVKIQFHKRFILKHVNYFLTPSDHLTTWINRKFPSLFGQTLYNPLLISPSNNIHYYTERRKDILYVGRISKEKGIITLIKAFDKISEEYPNENLLIIGEGPQEDYLKKTVEMKLLSKIQFIGKINRNELVGYYSSARFTVIPSEWIESFGNVLLESLAFKTPVIASNIGCIEFNTRKSKAGLVFKMGSSKDLAEKMRLLLQKPSLCKKLGERGHDYAQKRNFENHIQELTKIYELVLHSI